MSAHSIRRLAAIVMGDIVGYTRLMGADEKGTHVRVQRLFQELIDPTIVEHRGRLIKTQGDGFLAMFDSPVEAVRCAIVIQQSMVGRNLELPDAQWIRFRIGVNLGDVIVEPEDIYGEGVNIAARLEQLAEPGNIYISGGVYEQIRYKLVCGYQSLGDRRVKNIADPVPIYRVLPDPASLAKATRGGSLRLGWLAASLVVIIAVAGVGGWFSRNRSGEQSPQTLAAAPQAPAPPARAISVGDAPTSTPDAALGQSPARSDPPPIASLPPPPPAQAQVAVVVPPLQTGRPEVSPAVLEPEMILIKGGTFRMGSSEDSSEQPVRSVTIGAFLIAKYPVTVKEWRACVMAKACTYVPDSGDDAPVNNVSWVDAQQFALWISRATQQHYRLPSEAEWEYAARAGTDTRYWWGNTMKPGFADCKGCGGPHDSLQPTQVGALPANPYGLNDIGGGLAEWVEDCWHKDYHGAPTNGSAWTMPNCRDRVLRGGSWRNDPSYIRSSNRDYYDATVRYPTHGIRVARNP